MKDSSNNKVIKITTLVVIHQYC